MLNVVPATTSVMNACKVHIPAWDVGPCIEPPPSELPPLQEIANNNMMSSACFLIDKLGLFFINSILP